MVCGELCLAEDLHERGLHRRDEPVEPVLDGALAVEVDGEWHVLLSLLGVHSNGGLGGHGRCRGVVGVSLRRELQLGDVVEAVSEVLLHRLGVVSERQQVEQGRIGEEVESGEGLALRLQVLEQRLLAHFQADLHGLQSLRPVVGRAGLDDVGSVLRVCHELAPVAVDLVESLAVLRQLDADILAAEVDCLEPLPSLGVDHTSVVDNRIEGNWKGYG